VFYRNEYCLQIKVYIKHIIFFAFSCNCAQLRTESRRTSFKTESAYRHAEAPQHLHLNRRLNLTVWWLF